MLLEPGLSLHGLVSSVSHPRGANDRGCREQVQVLVGQRIGHIRFERESNALVMGVERPCMGFNMSSGAFLDWTCNSSGST